MYGDRSEGVNVIGYFHDPSGVGEIARLVVRSLIAEGIPHDVVAVGSRPIAQRLRPQQARFRTNIVCINPRDLPGFVDTVGRSLLRDNRTIGFWWWEVDRFPASYALAAHLVDEIWVGSQHVHDAVESATGKPVSVFPVPILVEPTPTIDVAALGLPRDRFAFLFSFNFSSAFERKNPLGLIEAFERAFDPTDGALLVLKALNGKAWPRQRVALEAAVAGRSDIALIDRPLSSEMYRGLVAACDAYISLHRAEGFGLTIAEAMALGKPAIATAYSGNLEFMTDENSYLVPYTLVPIPPGVSPYPDGAHWADPDLDAAAATMRAVLDDAEAGHARGERGRDDVRAHHGVKRAGAFIADQLRLQPPPARKLVDPIDRAASELVWGPDFEYARPWARRARRLLKPFLRPYVDHHRDVAALLIEAIDDRGEQAGENTASEHQPLSAIDASAERLDEHHD
jgi:glycosyltransferase involved in cell wall biosynthesis